MNKTLCHVTFSEYPKDPRIRRYVNALILENYRVFVICLKTLNHPFFEHNKNLTIFRIPVTKKRRGVLSRFLEYVYFQLIASLLVSYLTFFNNIRIFHTHTLPDFLVFSCLVPKLLGKKIILDFHELFPEFLMQQNPALTINSFLIKILLFQERKSFGFANHIITFHDPAKEILLSRCNNTKNITTVMNGIDELEVKPIEKAQTEEFRLIYNGTINANINLQIVIHAFKIIKEKYPDTYSKLFLYLYGEGSEVESLLALADKLNIKNIKYNKWIEFDDMVKELGFATACILPANKDIYSDLYYSVKLTEMIFFKIPVIASKLDTYLFYYPQECLIYFEPGNKEDLVNKIIYCFNNREELKNFSEKAFDKYQNYKWEIMKGRYIEIVKSMEI